MNLDEECEFSNLIQINQTWIAVEVHRMKRYKSPGVSAASVLVKVLGITLYLSFLMKERK